MFSEIRELRLLESTEISPIKVTSHKTNVRTSTSANCTLLEVCEEYSQDKENENSSIGFDGSFNSSSSQKKKFGVNESANSSFSKKMVVVNSRYANIFKENRVITRKALPLKDGTDKTKKARPPIVPTNKPATKPPMKAIDPSERLQADLDSVYCQYMQSLYINCLSNEAVKQQESLLMNEYKSHNEKLVRLTKEVNSLDSVISDLTMAKTLKNTVDTKVREIDALLAVLDKSQLEEFVRKLEYCSQLVELDADVEIGSISPESVSTIDRFARTTVAGDNNTDVVGTFARLELMLADLNEVFSEQLDQSALFQKKFVYYVYSLLKNVPN